MGNRESWEIGLRIKKVREALEMSQMKLAESVGVSFQQIQKYEGGINKVSIEKLRKISAALNTPLTYFIGMEKRSKQRDLIADKGIRYEEIGFEELSSEEMQLVLRFRSVKNENVREGVSLLLKGVREMEIG